MIWFVLFCFTLHRARKLTDNKEELKEQHKHEIMRYRCEIADLKKEIYKLNEKAEWKQELLEAIEEFKREVE